MKVRRAWVAGSFYPASYESLKRNIEECFHHPLGPGDLTKRKSTERNIVSVICPHAGYIYSGPAAAHSYHSLAFEPEPDSIILLGPNHTGIGSPISLWSNGSWETPIGKVPVDAEFARQIFDVSGFIDVDETAHLREHSLEVQIPFLQFIYEAPKIVPICMGFQDLKTSRDLGKAIVEASTNKDVLIIASTDLNHMENKVLSNEKDKGVIDRITALDEEGLQNWVRSKRVSMCGYGPVSTAIYASKELGAKKCELLTYYTSGDVTGDTSRVVGYAAAKISR
jgi:AmmeMemoRadiSam system protein B